MIKIKTKEKLLAEVLDVKGEPRDMIYNAVTTIAEEYGLTYGEVVFILGEYMQDVRNAAMKHKYKTGIPAMVVSEEKDVKRKPAKEKKLERHQVAALHKGDIKLKRKTFRLPRHGKQIGAKRCVCGANMIQTKEKGLLNWACPVEEREWDIIESELK